MMINRYSVLMLVLISALLLSGCTRTKPATTNNNASGQIENITLTYYRWQDNGRFLDDVIKKYQIQHPNVNIAVKQIILPFQSPRIDSRYDYQEYITKQIADGAGPDIFEVYNSWIPKLANQLTPAPEKTITSTQFKKEFSSVSAADFLVKDKVYAIPYYTDNLVLFYNPKLLERAGISGPPKTWHELINMVPLLTRIDQNGTLVSSAIALGADQASIPKFMDIIATLILQFGGEMTSADHTKAIFDKTADGISPGEEAIRLYTSFANPYSTNYTYTDETYFMGFRQFPSDVQAFGEGKTAMNIHYSSTASIIPKMYPSLIFALAPLPQLRLEQPVVMSGYWAETVSKNCLYPEIAWDFIRFVALEENIRTLSNTTQKIPSLSGLWDEYEVSPIYNVVASQAKYGATWYHGNEPDLWEKVFAKAVNNVLRFNMDARDAVDIAAVEIGQMLIQ